MARIRGSGFRTSSPRSSKRKSSWQIGPQTGVDGALQSVVASSATIATGIITITADGGTLVRTRGDLNIFLSVASGAADGYHGAFGIAMISLAAATAGVASIPTPITEESWDGWLYHRYFSIFPGETIAAATAAQQADQVNATSAALHIEVDSKAMRKEETDMALYASLEVILQGAAATLRWAFNSRMLVKLP